MHIPKLILEGPFLIFPSAWNILTWSTLLLKNTTNQIVTASPVQCTAFFRSSHRFSIGFGPGSFQNSNLLLVKPFILITSGFLLGTWRFCAKTDEYLEVFIIPSTLTQAPVPVKEKQAQSLMPLPPRFTVGMVLFWWCAVLFLRHIYLLELCPKRLTQIPLVPLMLL